MLYCARFLHIVGSQKLAKELLDFTKDCVSAARFVDFMLSRYPEQGRRAIENYRRFYGI